MNIKEVMVRLNYMLWKWKISVKKTQNSHLLKLFRYQSQTLSRPPKTKNHISNWHAIIACINPNYTQPKTTNNQIFSAFWGQIYKSHIYKHTAHSTHLDERMFERCRVPNKARIYSELHPARHKCSHTDKNLHHRFHYHIAHMSRVKHAF